MSGTEYGFSLCYQPPERFSIRPSGLKIFTIAPAGSFWSTHVISSAVLYWFRFLSAQFAFCFNFLRFFSFSLLVLDLHGSLSLLLPNPLNLESLTRCRRRESGRARRLERFGVGVVHWFEDLTPLTKFDRRVELSGVHIREVE